MHARAAVSATDGDSHHDNDPDEQILVLLMPELPTRNIAKSRLHFANELLYKTVKAAVQTGADDDAEGPTSRSSAMNRTWRETYLR